MKVFRFTMNIDDEIIAESLADAWQIIKVRDEDNWYGPTIANLEFIREEEMETVPE